MAVKCHRRLVTMQARGDIYTPDAVVVFGLSIDDNAVQQSAPKDMHVDNVVMRDSWLAASI